MSQLRQGAPAVSTKPGLVLDESAATRDAEGEEPLGELAGKDVKAESWGDPTAKTALVRVRDLSIAGSVNP
eukprot:11388006-Alexandrium_andersonii.AAC.1